MYVRTRERVLRVPYSVIGSRCMTQVCQLGCWASKTLQEKLELHTVKIRM